MKTEDLKEKGIFFVIGLSEPPININDSNLNKPQRQWKFAIMIKKGHHSHSVLFCRSLDSLTSDSKHLVQGVYFLKLSTSN